MDAGRLGEPAQGKGWSAAAGLGDSGRTRGQDPHPLVLLSRKRPAASKTKLKGVFRVAISSPYCWLLDTKSNTPGLKDQREIVSGEP